MQHMNILMVCGLLFLSACSSDVGPYSVSAQNVVAARSVAAESSKRVSDVSSSAENKENWISCRGIAVGLPDEQTFDSYIASALQDELALGDLMSPNGDIHLTVHLASMDFSSYQGTWKLTADIFANGVNQFRAIGFHDHDVAFAAVQECDNAATNFENAVQDLIKNILANPKFKALFRA